MRIGMISDLHLAPGRDSRCTTSPEDLIRLIDQLQEICDEVVIVGDAFDLLRSRRLRGWARALDRLRVEQPDLMAAISGCKQVVGNHDHPLCARGVPAEVSYMSDKFKFIVMHGHQWDVWLKKIWGMEEGANFVAGWCERVGLGKVSEWMGDVPGKVQEWTIGATESVPPEEQSAWHGAEQELERGWDILAMGHTHGLELKVIEETGKLVINTGSHVHGYQDLAILDLAQGVACTVRDRKLVQVSVFDDECGGWEVSREEGRDRAWCVQEYGELLEDEK